MSSFIQDMYTRTLLYPYLFGKAPLFYALAKSHPPQIKSESSSPFLPETPTSLTSFYSDKVLPPPAPRLEKAIVHSSKLRSKTVLDYYKNKGLQWLRRYDVQRFPSMLRNPTMGCTVELSSKPTLYTVHIDSKEAKKIICRECYF